ncbi:MAG: epimerase, partial [Acidobacteriota bacterium]
HPAPVMKAYIQTRMDAEARLLESGMDITILRPWYVLGPGHRWAYALIPFYKLFELIPATRPGALRCGLVTLPQMLGALMYAVENPVKGIRILEVPEIRRQMKSAPG